LHFAHTRELEDI
jgi:hypothetical protein